VPRLRNRGRGTHRQIDIASLERSSMLAGYIRQQHRMPKATTLHSV